MIYHYQWLYLFQAASLNHIDLNPWPEYPEALAALVVHLKCTVMLMLGGGFKWAVHVSATRWIGR